MANRLREETEEQTEQPARKERKNRNKASWTQRLESIQSFLSDERNQKSFGLFLLLSSLFLSLSFLSNLFTWKSDQFISGIESNWDLLFSNDVQVENWLGKLGSLAALTLQVRWFGIASFAIPFLLFLIAVRVIWKRNLLNVGPTLRYTFFSVIWLSTSLGFILQKSSDSLVFAGGYGYEMSMMLKGLVGLVGAIAVLTFSLLAILVAAFNIPLGWSTAKPVNDAAIPEIKQTPIAATDTKNSFLKNQIPAVVELELEREDIAETADESEDDLDAIDISDEDEVDEDETDQNEFELDSSVTSVDEKESLSEDGIVPMEVATITQDEAVVDEDEELVHAQGDYDPTLDLSAYHYPTLDLLENYGDKRIEVNKEELEANKNRIVETLGHYNIGIDKIKATIGPTVTLFEIVPQAGVRISKIKNLEDDIALSLSALGIRIIAPIPGRG
ncbi:MAG: DNA translocase FtsK 4TM domain-containing protein, partial [Bacteroidota bacterium]